MKNDDNLPLSEVYRKTGEAWADAEAEAQLLEDMKSVVMAQRQAKLGDIPVNRAEQIVKADPEWEQYIKTMVNARERANKLKVEVESVKMAHAERQSAEANRRAELRMLGDSP